MGRSLRTRPMFMKRAPPPKDTRIPELPTAQSAPAFQNIVSVQAYLMLEPNSILCHAVLAIHLGEQVIIWEADVSTMVY